MIRSIRTVHEGWSRFAVATIAEEDGTTFHREIEDHGNAVAVLPYDPDRRTAMLVRVMRAPVLHAGGDPHVLEAPAGLIEDEDPEEAARREAREETGLRLGPLEFVVNAWASPGISTERIALYLARYTAADRIEAGGGLADENEDLAVLELPLDELWRFFEQGEVVDMKTVALTLALRQRRPDLFG